MLRNFGSNPFLYRTVRALTGPPKLDYVDIPSGCPGGAAGGQEDDAHGADSGIGRRACCTIGACARPVAQPEIHAPRCVRRLHCCSLMRVGLRRHTPTARSAV